MLIYFLDDDSHSHTDELEMVLMREDKDVYNEFFQEKEVSGLVE